VPVWTEVAERFEAHTRRALWLTQVLQRILAALESDGIQAIPYKGPLLADRLYGNVAFRQYTDLDILIHLGDLPKATATLGELGLSPHLQLSRAQHQAYVTSHYEYAFDGFGAANLVELRWRILPTFYAVDLDTEGLFQRARPFDLLGTTTLTLSPEDLFVVLCAHAAKHLWGRVSWIYEIARLSESESMDWRAVEKQVRELGMERMVAVTASLAQSLFGIKIRRMPEHDAMISNITERVAQRLAAGEQPDTESVGYFREILQLRERPSDRRTFVWRLATTPSVSEWESVRLTEALFPLYRGVRLLRLLRRIG